jgi:hypothetical protein
MPIDLQRMALFLGHESIETTTIYLHVDPTLKEQALAKTVPTNLRSRRYRPGDRIQAFLKSL